MTLGYEQTEVGVIPEEWDVTNVGDVCTLINGRGFKPHEWKTSGLPIIRIQNLNGSENFNYFTGSYNPKILVETGQLLFAWSGSRGTSFGPHVWYGGRALLNYHTWKVAVKESKATQEFLLHALRHLTSYIEDRAHGASALVHTQKWEMEKFPILIPSSLPEQRAIAWALSDVDALIGTLDSALAKKRDLKQAAMQELLTGKTRLPGFNGNWKVKTLKELFVFSGGYSASRDQLSSEGHCYLHYGDIHKSAKSFIDVRAEYQDIPKFKIPLKQISARSLLDDGDVVFVDASEDDEGTSKHVVVLNKDKTPYIAGLHTIVAKGKTEELAHPYRRYCFQSAAIRQQFLFYAVGTKVSGISKTNIAKLTLPVPSLPEQSAIATVLSDMDAEIAALEQRRDKTRDLKQGMMQELLTGRIRLPISISSKETPQQAGSAQSENTRHNWAFNEAVVIAALTNKFGSREYPLGRLRYTKLAYLMHRHVEGNAKGYLKKAAGPYNPATRYKGPEGIAQKNGYVRAARSRTLFGFVSGENINQALVYFRKWYGSEVLEWLEQFRYEKNEALELLATVDMAILDLRAAGKKTTVENIKEVLRIDPEWKPKLRREVFSDTNIKRTIAKCQDLYG